MPPAAAPCASGSGISVTTTSDVKKVLATEAAFSKAHRTTFVGSMIPAFKRSSYTPVGSSSHYSGCIHGQTCADYAKLLLGGGTWLAVSPHEYS